ncbi:MAG: alpha/beta hydrolase [Steroidobacteraceae bacterium]|nr:alpha/beta hydrolase [Steroidobacteraceae bacterium]MDW8257950.1 alpha/beta fold hydrolase [Gammaproteobacteria bacterium]
MLTSIRRAFALAALGAFHPSAHALSFQECHLEHPLRVAAYPAECGFLAVPEERRQRGGRTIALRIARVAAVSSRKAPDPLFLIAGGPGGSTVDLYTTVASAFARVNRDRDIVLLDQRGTGGSNPLHCAFDDTELLEAEPARLRALAERCRDDLSRHADLAQYTTSVAVRDLDAVRAALGYERINLYGISYGTRVAQHYLRRYPERTRAVILDGVVAPDVVLPAGIALDAEAALAQVLARCRATPACTAQFGDPHRHYRAVRARVSAAPVQLRVPDPRSGALRELRFDRLQLALVLRLQLYNAQSAAVLPLALWQAAVHDDFRALGAQALLLQGSLRDQLAIGMHNSVVCAEDDPRLDIEPADRARLESTFIGPTLHDAIRAMCSVWPRGPVDADFFEPVPSSRPVLLLSGGADPVTPPGYAERALRRLANARHLQVPGIGHGLLGVPCIERILADFLAKPDPRALDARCLDRVRPAAFFVSPAGPGP